MRKRRKLSLATFRQLFKRFIAERYSVRWHMALMLAGVGLAGVVTSKLLLFGGIRSMLVRYLVAITLSWSTASAALGSRMELA